MAIRRYWRKKTEGEWTPEGRVSDEELLNRVILTKSLQVYASNYPLHFRTKDGDFEITPRVARDVIKASGKWPLKTFKEPKPPKTKVREGARKKTKG